MELEQEGEGREWSKESSELGNLASSWKTLTIRDLNEERTVSVGTHILANGLFAWHLVVLFPCF